MISVLNVPIQCTMEVALLYYLANKNLPAHLHVYFSLESSNHKKIGEIIKALQIC